MRWAMGPRQQWGPCGSGGGLFCCQGWAHWAYCTGSAHASLPRSPQVLGNLGVGGLLACSGVLLVLSETGKEAHRGASQARFGLLISQMRSLSRVFANVPQSSSGLQAQLGPSFGVACGVLEVIVSGENGVEKMTLASLNPESGVEDLDCWCWGLKDSSCTTTEEAWLIKQTWDVDVVADPTVESMEWGVDGLGAIKSSGLTLSDWTKTGMIWVLLELLEFEEVWAARTAYLLRYLLKSAEKAEWGQLLTAIRRSKEAKENISKVLGVLHARGECPY